MTNQARAAGDAKTWPHLTLYDLLVRAARTWPDRLALVTPHKSHTYETLLQSVRALTRGMHEAGVGPADRVATLFGTRGEWVVLQYALAFLGAKVVPLNTRFHAEELRYALAQAQATVLVTMDRDGSQDLAARVVEACPGVQNARDGRVADQALPELRLVIGCSPAGRRFEHWLDWRSLTGSPTETDGEPLHQHSTSVRPEDTAIILFTSGSTGRPKAACLSHRNVIGHAHYLSRFLGLEPDDRYINLLPFFHIAGYVQGPVLNHYAGSTLYLVDSFKPEEVLATMVRHRITAWAGMPVTVQRVLDLAHDTHADLSSLDKQHGVSPEMWDRVLHETNVRVMTRMYGLTESAGLVAMSRPWEKDQTYRRASVGLPLPGVSVRIIDPGTNQTLPRGQAGEIAFKGWNCFSGYFGDAQTTARTIDDGGYCHTGDQGLVDADGCLHLLGRFKEIVKTGGENVSCLELELFLKEHIPGMRAACVIGIPDATWGEAVTAVVEPNRNALISPEFVRAECARYLASFKVPRHVLLIRSEEWPLTGSGKVDRSSLGKWVIGKLGTSQGHRLDPSRA